MDHCLDTGIVFRIRDYWEIQKVVNGHKSAAHTDSPDGGTGKTCLAEVCSVPVLLVSVDSPDLIRSIKTKALETLAADFYRPYMLDALKRKRHGKKC